MDTRSLNRLPLTVLFDEVGRPAQLQSGDIVCVAPDDCLTFSRDGLEIDARLAVPGEVAAKPYHVPWSESVDREQQIDELMRHLGELTGLSHVVVPTDTANLVFELVSRN